MLYSPRLLMFLGIVRVPVISSGPQGSDIAGGTLYCRL